MQKAACTIAPLFFAAKWAGRAGENETNCADNLQHFGWARQFGLCHYWVSRPLLRAAMKMDGRFLALSTPLLLAPI
jgi:hypothetical protein